MRIFLSEPNLSLNFDQEANVDFEPEELRVFTDDACKTFNPGIFFLPIDAKKDLELKRPGSELFLEFLTAFFVRSVQFAKFCFCLIANFFKGRS